MSKIGKSDGVQIQVTAPGGGVTQDAPFFSGRGWLIPLRDAAAGVMVDCYARGSYSLPVASGQTFVANDSVWYDTINDECIDTDDGTEAIGSYGGVDDQDATRIVVNLFGPSRSLADAEGMTLVASPTADNLCAMDATGQATDSGIAAANVPQMAAAATAAGQIVASADADKTTAAMAGTEIHAAAATTAAKINLFEGTDNGTHYASVKASDSLVGTVELEISGNLKTSEAVTMQNVGGVGEVLYTAAGDRAASKSGITKTALEGLIAAAVMPTGPLSDGGTNAIAVTIDIQNLLGVNVAAPKVCRVWTSTEALGAFAAQITSLTVTAGTQLWEDIAADGEGLYLTDATSNLNVTANYAVGALNTFLNVDCGGHVDSVELQFA